MEIQKKNSTSMYELLSVNELKPVNNTKENKDNKDNKDNKQSTDPNSYINTGNLNSLSNFLNSTNPIPFNNKGEIDYQNKIKVVKGDFYTDPEIIKKNCELFPPESIKNTVQSSILFNERQNYKGILVLTEYRLIFKEEKPIPIKLPENYLKFPLMSIAKLEKIQNPKTDYDTYVIEVTLKDSRLIRFFVKDNIHSTFYLNLETARFPNDLKVLYKFTELYHNEIKKEKSYFNGWSIYDPIREFSREGVTEDNNLGLRFCYANKNFKLCETYPEFLIEPAKMSDEELKQASQYRTKNRLPIMAYYYFNPNEDEKCVPTIWRSAQNKGGLMGSKKNESDINLIKYIQEMSKNLYIFDCRPKLNAMVNRLNGGGFENVDHYDNADLTFCEIDNIHKARSAVNSLYSLCLSEKINDNYKFWTAVDNTGWFTFVYLLLKNADEISKKLQEGNSVLIHCSDGWDRTSQLSSLSQILLDPFFRTINGFAVLIEKDWLSFGHQFRYRCGMYCPSDSPSNVAGENQKSPVFIQWLDAVYQIMCQNMVKFEFNTELLFFLANQMFNGKYGTFLFNNEQERDQFNAREKTLSVWSYVKENENRFLNPIYNPNDNLPFIMNYKRIQLWGKYFFRFEDGDNCFNEKITKIVNDLNKTIKKDEDIINDLVNFINKKLPGVDVSSLNPDTQNLFKKKSKVKK